MPGQPTDREQDGFTTKLSSRSVSDTVAKFVDLLNEKGIRVFDVIDQTAAAREVGLEMRQTTLVIWGSPKAGTPVMVASPMSALDLPLKILVWDDGGQTKVSYVTPSTLAARYELSSELASPLAGIDALTDALVNS